MDEKDNSRSSLQTAADLGRAAKAAYRIAQAAAVSGVHGAAATAVKETVPALVKFLLAVLLIMIVIPMVVFTALPNIFFGYDSSDTASVIHMTEQAMRIGGAYMSLDDFERTQIDSIVTGIAAEYEADGTAIDHNRAQASRRQASRSQRRFFAAREDLHAVGSRITCRMLAVGPRRCLVDCYGYDLDMTQKAIRYAAIPDLRTEFHPGSEIDCIVKEYHPRTGELIVSAKETEVNPFFGAEERHPVGSRRFAMISGKYGGGVFCNLPDGVTCMCNYSYQHEDADFMVGEHVMLMVQRYDQEKLQMYGKIMSKW